MPALTMQKVVLETNIQSLNKPPTPRYKNNPTLLNASEVTYAYSADRGTRTHLGSRAWPVSI